MAETMTGLQRQYRAARDKSVPLVVMRTVDPGACLRALEPVTRVGDDERLAPIIQWTCTSGFEPVRVGDGATQGVLRTLGQNIINPVEALAKGLMTPAGTTVAYLNLSAYWQDPRVKQAFWNLRDPLKQNFRMAINMGMDASVPTSLEHDVLTIEEPLPGFDELAQIIRAAYVSAKLKVAPSDDDVRRAVDAVVGLSAFAAEQAVALSIGSRGLNFDALRDRHRSMIENTKGLSVWRGGETFASVGGLRAFIAFARRFLAAGRFRPGAVLWIDELEKVMAGARGDLSGVSQYYLGSVLTYLQDYKIPAILLMGHPGGGKSLLAKAFAGEAAVPCVKVDMGGMKGHLMGESEAALGHALKVSTAISQGRPIVIATCNSVDVLPAELINRFKWRFFVDLPTAEEKATIWPIHIKARGLDANQPRPDDAEWNGREIEQCCDNAHQMNCSLLEAAQWVVPISQSSAEEIERRRRDAAGRYLSASYPGSYAYERKETVTVGQRQIRVDDTAWVAPAGSKAN